MEKLKHPRVRVVAREEDAEFVECQECGDVFESSEFKDMAMREHQARRGPELFPSAWRLNSSHIGGGDFLPFFHRCASVSFLGLFQKIERSNKIDKSLLRHFMSMLALVIDDSMLIRHTVCRRFLELAGLRVETAKQRDCSPGSFKVYPAGLDRSPICKCPSSALSVD